MFHEIVLIGNLGIDPQLTEVSPISIVCNFTVASNNAGHTTWFRISAWGKVANSCAKYLSKGDTVFIKGRLQPGKDGNPQRERYELVASEIKFLITQSGATKTEKEILAIEITCINCGTIWKTRDRPHPYCPNCNVANYIP